MPPARQRRIQGSGPNSRLREMIYAMAIRPPVASVSDCGRSSLNICSHPSPSFASINTPESTFRDRGPQKMAGNAREHPDEFDYKVLLARGYSRLARLANNQRQTNAKFWFQALGPQIEKGESNSERRRPRTSRGAKGTLDGRHLQRGSCSRAAPAASPTRPALATLMRPPSWRRACRSTVRSTAPSTLDEPARPPILFWGCRPSTFRCL